MTLDAMIELVARAVRVVAEREKIALPSDVGADLALFGERGPFDSLGLVTLVLEVEEAIQDTLGARVSLADERAMSQARSPFRSVRTLAEYALGMVGEPGASVS